MYFLLMIIALILAIVFGMLGVKNMRSSATDKKVIVLGMDGLDPNILERLMSEGKLPNFSKLKQSGTYSRLATTNPAQSPVAWSSFITGTNPGGNNIFDFLIRDPETYMPDLCLAKSEAPKSFDIGKIKIPLGSSEIKSYRKGTPFWDILSENNIPSVILRCPMTYPPDKIYGKMLSGFGVTDIQGTEGTFSYYTTESNSDKEEISGKIVPVEIDDNQIISTFLYGPIDTASKDFKQITVPLKIKINGERTGITIDLGGKQQEIKIGEWSDWVRVSFKVNNFTKITGICRLHLKRVDPEFGLYLSPVNFDPENPHSLFLIQLHIQKNCQKK